MNRASARHVGLGVAGTLMTCTSDVATLSLWVAKTGSRIPLAAPLRRPARRLVRAAEHRGALNEARVLSDARHISNEWFARAAGGPLLDHVVRTLVEAGTLNWVLETAARQGAGTRAAPPTTDGDQVVRLALHLHVTDPAPDHALARHMEGGVDDARDRSREGGDPMAGQARRQAHPALLAGFEGGAAPA
jgi:hypothetical protein